MSHHKRNEASFLKSSLTWRIFAVNSDRPSGGKFRQHWWLLMAVLIFNLVPVSSALMDSLAVPFFAMVSVQIDGVVADHRITRSANP